MQILFESWQTCKDEVGKLAFSHSDEVDWYLDKIETDPDWDQYDLIDKAGVIYPIIARDDDGNMIGYSVYFLWPSLHYKKEVFAQNDIFYVVPEYRKQGLGFDLLQVSERVLSNAGATLIDMCMKSNHTFHKLMEHCDYDLTEHRYTKYIGE